MTTIHLPFPLTMSAYYRHTVFMGRPKTRISERGHEYAAAVDAVVRKIIGPRPLHAHGERLKVAVMVYPPDRRARDLDNLGKALLDALTKARVWADDSQIDHLTFRRMCIHQGGVAVVQIDIIPPLTA